MESLTFKHERPYNGALVKKGHIIKSWKKRDFSLDGNVLSYSEKDVVKGSYTIDATSSVCKNPDTDEYANVFTLTTVKGALTMAAETSEERDIWIHIIEETINGGPLIDIPDVLVGTFNATVPLKISFPSGAIATGNELAPSQIRRQPVVAFKTGANKLYTLIMIDPDAPSRAEPMYREFVHWVVVNMHGCDVTSGETVAPYFGAAPPYNSGFHRYYIFLYEQPSPLSTTEVNNLFDYFVRRGGFTLSRWAAKMGYSYPVGVQGFRAQWDSYVDILHNEMRFMPPMQYRSPSQTKAMLEFSSMEQNVKYEQDYRSACKNGEEYCKALGLSSFYPTIKNANERSNSIAGSSKAPTPVYMKVKYPFDKFVYKGMPLLPSDTCTVPEVSYGDFTKPDSYYTLILTNPDFYHPDKPTLREYIHWVVVNIPGKSKNTNNSNSNIVKDGVTVLPYMGPCPVYGTGMHRYVYLLFEQSKGLLNKSDISSSKDYFGPRGGLSTSTWVKKYISYDTTTSAPSTDTTSTSSTESIHSIPLNTFYPVGINGFTSEWDHTCDDIHAQFDVSIPREYQSPHQKAHGVGKNSSNSKSKTSDNVAHAPTPINEELKGYMSTCPKLFNGGTLFSLYCFQYVISIVICMYVQHIYS